MLRFLEREGYDVSYTTDVDTHARGDLIALHRAFLSVGHDEYWSGRMRHNLEVARDRGVSLGFFGSNIGFWQIRFENSAVTGDANRTIVCYKRVELDPMAADADPGNRHYTTTLFRLPPVNEPEAQLIGQMHEANSTEGDITVEDASSWVFENTGLKNGDRLPGLLGYEVDRMYDSAPQGTKRIAHSAFYVKAQLQYADMTVYEWPSGSTVVATGSMQWNWGLDDGFTMRRRSYVNPAAQQATSNILGRFGATPAAKR